MERIGRDYAVGKLGTSGGSGGKLGTKVPGGVREGIVRLFIAMKNAIKYVPQNH